MINTDEIYVMQEGNKSKIIKPTIRKKWYLFYLFGVTNKTLLKLFLSTS